MDMKSWCNAHRLTHPQCVQAVVTKHHSPSGLGTIEMHCLQFWRLKSRIRVPVQSGEGSLLGHRLLTVSPHGEKGKGDLWGHFYRGTDLIHKSFTLLT